MHGATRVRGEELSAFAGADWGGAADAGSGGGGRSWRGRWVRGWERGGWWVWRWGKRWARDLVWDGGVSGLRARREGEGNVSSMRIEGFLPGWVDLVWRWGSGRVGGCVEGGGWQMIRFPYWGYYKGGLA